MNEWAPKHGDHSFIVLNLLVMKNISLLFFILLAGLQLNAQQDHHYTQFMYNKLLLNPAYAGARGVPSVTAIYRNQWIGFDGAPKSFLASFNSPFLSKRVGVGVTVSNRSIGLQRDFLASLAYSYDMVATEKVSVRVGLNGSLRSLGVDFAKAQPIPGQGPFSDPAIGNQRDNNFYGNVGAGLYGTYDNKVYVGFSVPRIYANIIGYNPNPKSDSIAKESRHFYGTAGAIIPLSDDINLMPAFLLKYVKNAPFDADINLNLDIRQKLTVGLSYRLGGDGPGESLDLLAFWQTSPQFGIGAAYDFSLSNIKDYTAGSIEVMVLYELRKKSKKSMSNPRFFM